MDPASAALGIIPLVALAAQTALFAKNFISSAKGAKESIEALVNELETLKSNLEKLDENLKNESKNEGGSSLRFPQTSVLRSSAIACEARLSKLKRKLEKAASKSQSKFGPGRLTWPFNEEDHRKLMQDLRAFAQWTHFGLTIDGCALLSRTSKDVVAILHSQLETFDSVRSLEERTSAVEDALRNQTVALTTDHDHRVRDEILSWVSGYPYFKKHNDIRSQRAEGTGTWLLERVEYKNWRDELTFPNILWCHGVQGSGKSILTSMVVEELIPFTTEKGCPIAYAYFDYGDQELQTHSTLVASIFKQILTTMATIPSNITEALEKSRRQGVSLSPQEITRMIVDIASQVPAIYLILDALDECDESKHRESVIETLTELRKLPNIRIFVTSRPHPHDIISAFENDQQIIIKAHEADIRLFLAQKIRKARVPGIDEQLTENIVTTVAANAQGVFLLALLQIRTILNEQTAGGVEDALNDLYQSLHQAFEGTITQICQEPKAKKEIGLKSLLWICHAKRPLYVAELGEVLAVDIGQKDARPRHRPWPEVILDACQGLVTIDKEMLRFRFIHFAVHEHLIKRSDQLFPSVGDRMAATCLSYLLFDAFQNGPCESHSEIEERVRKYPFLPYASTYMGSHCRAFEQDDLTSQWLARLTDCQPAIAAGSQVERWAGNYVSNYWSMEESNSYTALHMATHCGLSATVSKLLKQQTQDINAKTSIGTTPVIAASASGHEQITKMLLEQGADPYLSNWYGNALHCAAESGKTSTIQVLLDFGVDVEIARNFGQTPLHCTADRDKAAAACMLIDKGANIDARDESGMSVLHLASECNSLELVSFLLQSGNVDLGSTSNRGSTALHYAAIEGNVAVAELLLKYGADVNTRDNSGRTPFDQAIRKDQWMMKNEILNMKFYG